MGASRPARTRTSKVLSSAEESEPLGWITGLMSSPKSPNA